MNLHYSESSKNQTHLVYQHFPPHCLVLKILIVILKRMLQKLVEWDVLLKISFLKDIAKEIANPLSVPH